MTIRCEACGRTMAVPPDKADVPNLRARCACGHVFVVAQAPRVNEGSPPPAPPRPAAPLAAPRPVAAPTPRPPVVGASWRRCANHPQLASAHVCTRCGQGYCQGCVQVVQGGAICTACDALCVPASDYDAGRRRDQERSRSLFEETGTILSYPLRDKLGFGMLVAVTFVFALAGSFFPSGIAFMLSTGILIWYAFHALGKVAGGNLKEFAPDFRDIDDLVQPARLSLAAVLISVGPVFVLLFFTAASVLLEGPVTLEPAAAPMEGVTLAPIEPPAEAASAEEPAGEESVDEGETEEEPSAAAPAAIPTPDPEPIESGPSPVLLIAVALAGLWALVYAPVALTVAALSRSFFSTLNPVIGIDTIRRMGAVYWQAWAFYLGLTLFEVGAGFVFNLIPFAGAFLTWTLRAYCGLAVACALGLAVYKKGPELGWD